MPVIDARVRTMLQSRPIAALATIDSQGFPHVVPMWIQYQDGRIFMPTSHRTVKVANLRRDPRAAVLVHEASGGMSLQGALIQGPVEVVDGDEARLRNRAIHRLYLSEAELGRGAIGGYLADDDVTLVLSPERVRTWDLSGLVQQ